MHRGRDAPWYRAAVRGGQDDETRLVRGFGVVTARERREADLFFESLTGEPVRRQPRGRERGEAPAWEAFEARGALWHEKAAHLVPGEAGATVDPVEKATKGFAGIDSAAYPGLTAMTWLMGNTNLWWTGFYLFGAPCVAPATGSWMPPSPPPKGRRGTVLPDLQGTSPPWGAAPIYVGQQLAGSSSCGSNDLTFARGKVDAADAIRLASNAGFPTGSNVFLDLETPDPPYVEYYRGWAAEMIAKGSYYPGVYCSHASAESLYLADSRPIFWVFNIDRYSCAATNPTAKPTVITPQAPFPTEHPSGSGICFAKLWQLAQSGQGCKLARADPDPRPLGIDFDTAVAKDPSTIQQDPFNTLVDVFTAQVYTKGWTTFAPFSIGAGRKRRQGYLCHKAGTGDVAIDRFRNAGRPDVTTRWPVDNLFSDNWGADLTHFVLFTQGAAERCFGYAGGSGRVTMRTIAIVKNKATVKTDFDEINYTTSWTHFAPFELAGRASYFAYKAGSGDVSIDRFRTTGPAPTTRWPVDVLLSTSWGAGWTSIMTFVMNGRPHVFGYDASTGNVRVDRIDPVGKGASAVTLTNIYSKTGAYTLGWTHFTAFQLGGQPHYLAYKLGTGDISIDQLLPSPDPKTGLPVLVRASDKWSTKWTSWIPFAQNGIQHFFAYDAKDGWVTTDYYWVRFERSALKYA